MLEDQPLYAGPLEGLLKEQVIESVRQKDQSAAADIWNNFQGHGAIPVIKYLSLHYGSPLQIEKLAVATHLSTGKITKPFEASNAAEMYSKLRRHLDAWNSLKSMATYMNKEHGLQVADARL